MIHGNRKIIFCMLGMLIWQGCGSASPEDTVRSVVRALHRKDYRILLKKTVGAPLAATAAAAGSLPVLERLRFRYLKAIQKYNPDGFVFLRAVYSPAGNRVSVRFLIRWAAGKNRVFLRYTWLIRRERDGWRFAGDE